MFNKQKDKKPNIKQEVDHIIGYMAGLEPDSKEYSTAASNLDVLVKAKSCENTTKKISPDTIAVVVGNLLGIVLVLNYEKMNVITSKAFGMIIKGRV